MFDGKRWCPDSLHTVVEFAKKTARLIVGEAKHLSDDKARTRRKDFANQTLGKGSLDRMLDLAKSLLAVKDECLDADPWLLNVENGSIDLRTGHLEKHDPRDLLTKVVPVQADRTAKCPIFKKFLERISGDDPDLASYIQRAVGYSLSGETTEQVFFFVFGRTGQNGKSTLVNLIREMLGDYGLHTQTESLLVKQYDNNIPADLARLRGARMVTAIEAEPQSPPRRSEDQGDDRRGTHRRPFHAAELFPVCADFQAVARGQRPASRPRHRPSVLAPVRVIPLGVSIPPTEPGSTPPSKLREEWPGILAWAVRGCLKWQKIGLTEPSAVRTASEGWQEEMDHLKAFVDSELIVAPGQKIASSKLFDITRNGAQAWRSVHSAVQDFKAKLQAAHNVTHPG